MSILSRIKALISRYNYGTFEILPGRPRSQAKDPRSLIQHNCGWPYVCASRNAETIAGVPLRLYAKGATRNYFSRRSLTAEEKSYLARATKQPMDVVDDAEEVTGNHPLLELMDRVNAEITRTQLIESTVLYQDLLGNAYWYLEPGPVGVPIAIWPLMSQYVKIVRSEAGELVGYLYGKSEDKRVALDVADVMHFKYPNPADPDYGMGCLEAALGAVNLLEAQEEYLTTHYDQGGMPEVAIAVKSGVSPEERKRMYADWRRKFASKSKGDKMIVLEGDTDVKTFGYPPSDSGVEFAQKFSREEVAGAFGIPLTLIQLNEASRAGAEAGNYSYMAYTIAPKLQRLAEKMTEQLAARYDPRLFFAFDNPIPADKAYELKRIDTMTRAKVMTVDEIRAEQGLPPLTPEQREELTPKPPPMLAPGTEPGEETAPEKPAEPEKSLKAEQPLTANERRFEAAITDYIVGFARELDERLAETI
jgi:HK97 family phage portal protein